MKETNLILISLFLIFTAGCDGAPNKKHLYLPYYESCKDDLARFKRHLKNLNPAIVTEVISPSKKAVEGDIHNGLVKIEFSSEQYEIIEPSLNRFNLDCGPNSSITMEKELLNEDEIRKQIGRITNSGLYKGKFWIEIENNKIVVYFTQE